MKTVTEAPTGVWFAVDAGRPASNQLSGRFVHVVVFHSSRRAWTGQLDPCLYAPHATLHNALPAPRCLPCRNTPVYSPALGGREEQRKGRVPPSPSPTSSKQPSPAAGRCRHCTKLADPCLVPSEHPGVAVSARSGTRTAMPSLASPAETLACLCRAIAVAGPTAVPMQTSPLAGALTAPSPPPSSSARAPTWPWHACDPTPGRRPPPCR